MGRVVWVVALLAVVDGSPAPSASPSAAPSTTSVVPTPIPLSSCNPAAVDPNCAKVKTSGGCSCEECAQGYILGDTDDGVNTRCIEDRRCQIKVTPSACMNAAHCEWRGFAAGCADKELIVVRGALSLTGVSYYNGFRQGLSPASLLVQSTMGSAVVDFVNGLLTEGLPAGKRPNDLNLAQQPMMKISTVHPGDATTCSQAPFNDPAGPNCQLPVQPITQGVSDGIKNYYQVAFGDATLKPLIKDVLKMAWNYTAGIESLQDEFRIVFTGKPVLVVDKVNSLPTESGVEYPDYIINLAVPAKCSDNWQGATETIEADGQLCTQDSTPTTPDGITTTGGTKIGHACICNNDAGAPRFRCEDGSCRLILSTGCNQPLKQGNECVSGSEKRGRVQGSDYCGCTESSDGLQLVCIAPGMGLCELDSAVAASATVRCMCVSNTIKASYPAVTGSPEEHSYIFYSQLGTAAYARQVCGGKLVRIESKAEADWIAEQMYKRGLQRAWVEGTRYSRLDWRNNDGTKVGVLQCTTGGVTGPCDCKVQNDPSCPWRPEQPTMDPFQDCLTISQALGDSEETKAWGNAKIGDEPCDHESHWRGVVCEFGYPVNAPPITAGAPSRSSLALALLTVFALILS